MKYFDIEGTIKHTSFTKISLARIVFDKKYYSIVVNDSSDIIKDKFLFKGFLPYPEPFKLSCYDSTSKTWTESEIFFVQPGKQYIRIDSLTNEMRISIENSASNKEFLHNYLIQVQPLADEWLNSFNKIDSVYDALNGKVPDSLLASMHNDEKRIKNKIDTFLFVYTKKNPNSYVALWKLIQKFHILGYSSIYSRIYDLFSVSIKSTYAGKELLKALKIGSLTGIGQTFPHMLLVDAYNKKVKLSTTEKQDKYVLLDFWFSHCGPCIAQFPQLKSIYNDFRPHGFEIISISTDKKSEKNSWNNAIKKYELTWTQYWDIGGIESNKMSINSFPSNILLDKNGKVIAKNIDPSQLNTFLKEKLLN